MNETAPPLSPPDALRFAFGTLTVLPVKVTRWDRAAARGGMAFAPLVGLVVGVFAAIAASVLVSLGANGLLAGVAAVAVPAVLTRGLHLDGLADTADGLGSGAPAEDALRIMKQSDIGPFGVMTLVLVLLGQAAAVAACYGHGWVHGSTAVVTAAVTGRTGMTLACRAGVPAARPGGLGAAVAGAVPARVAWTAAVCVTALGAAAGAAFGWPAAVRGAVAVAAGLLCGEALLRRCRARFRGVTGDVFGAVCEAGTTAALLVLALRGGS